MTNALVDVTPLMLREIARTLDEQRVAVTTALAEYLETEGETASLAATSVSSFNAGQVLIQGPGMTEAAAAYLRGAGYDVMHCGDMAIAAMKKKKRVDPGRAMVEGTKGGKKVQQLRFFNDEYSMRVANKLFKEQVEPNDYRHYATFLKALDNAVADARLREGHEADGDDEGPKQRKPAMLSAEPHRKAVAAFEGDDGLTPCVMLRDAQGNFSLIATTEGAPVVPFNGDPTGRIPTGPANQTVK